MHLLKSEECDDLGSELGANSTIEICTGRKKSFPEILKFHMNRHGKFQSRGVIKDYLGTENRKYDFYLGGTDSCQGVFVILRI